MRKDVQRPVMFGVALALLMGLFRSPPFVLAFVIVGLIATGIIKAVTGHMIAFWLVLVVLCLAMLSILFIGLHVAKRRLDRRFGKK